MQDTLSVSEAAKALGISPDAVRKRINRGTLQAVKIDDVWRITLPRHDDATMDATASSPASSGSGEANPLVESLQATIADLRTRLDSADARADTLIEDLRHERQRADTMQVYRLQAETRVHELESRVRELEALSPGQVHENEAVESPVSDTTAPTGISTHVEPDPAPESMLRRVWRVITGG